MELKKLFAKNVSRWSITSSINENQSFDEQVVIGDSLRREEKLKMSWHLRCQRSKKPAIIIVWELSASTCETFVHKQKVIVIEIKSNKSKLNLKIIEQITKSDRMAPPRSAIKAKEAKEKEAKVSYLFVRSKVVEFHNMTQLALNNGVE